MRQDIFEKAKTYGSFNNWLTSIPEEDLAYLSSITDDVRAGKLKGEVDEDSFQQMVALAMFFSGRTDDVSEDELEKLFQSLTVFVSCELNVRRGDFTKEGIYSMVPGEDSAKLKITPQGESRVRNMLGEQS